MIEYILLLGCLLAQTISFGMGYKIVFNQGYTGKKWRVVIFVLILLFVHSIVYKNRGPKTSYDFALITQFLIPVLLIEEKRFVKYIQYLFVFTMVSLTGIVLLNSIALIQDKPEYVYLDSINWLFLIESIVAVVYIVVYMLLRKRLIAYDMKISILGYVAITAVVLSSLCIVGCAQNISRMEIGNIISIINMATSVACLVPMLVVVWLIRSEKNRYELELHNKLSEELLKHQKKNNEDIINNNEQIRRFRHDLKGHLQIMLSYCHDKEFKKMEEYLLTLESDKFINNRTAFTGNMEIDALINNLSQRCEQKNIKLKVRGMLPKAFKRINVYDLSVIFFNLLNNAFEESERIISANPWIDVEVASYNDTLKLVIKNKAEKKKNVEEISSQKCDREIHGFGLRNVKSVVEKYEGTIDIKSTEDIFSVEILM